LCDQSVEIVVRRTLNVKSLPADVVESLIIKVKGEVGVFKKRVGGKNRVVWFNNGSRNLRRWCNGEAHLGLSAEVNSKTFKEKRSKTGSGSSSSGMEDEETLKCSAVIRHLAYFVHDIVNDILANGVVTTGVVVGSIFLSRNN
jgi:hypothetical protein